MSFLGEEYATIDDAFSGNSMYDQYLAFQNKDKEAEKEKLQEEKESSFLKQFGRTMNEAKLVEVTNVPLERMRYYIDANNDKNYYEYRYSQKLGKWFVTTRIYRIPVENPFSNIIVPDVSAKNDTKEQIENSSLNEIQNKQEN